MISFDENVSDETKLEFLNAIEALVRSQCEEIAKLHDDVARLNRVIALLLADETEGPQPIRDAIALWSGR